MIAAHVMYDPKHNELVALVHDPSRDRDVVLARWPVESDEARDLPERIERYHSA